MTSDESKAGKRVVCLGEALVDFVCERPVDSLADADFFVPRQGGSLANIAVTAARLTDRVEMIGGAGDDEWGRWLRDRLAEQGVGVGRFVLKEGAGTSHAFVSVAGNGEPSFAFYGDPERPAAHAAEHLDPSLAGDPGVLVVGSDTLLGQAERDVTMRAVALARERGWKVLCDPNLRPNRWESGDEMVRVISELVAGATVVKLNEGEAQRLSGCASTEDAGRRILELGPRAVVVTRGEHGALLLTESSIQHMDGVPVDVVDATGAGDSVCGVIAAVLAADVPLHTGVIAAMRIAAGVVASWGATEGLPSAAAARGLLGADA